MEPLFSWERDAPTTTRRRRGSADAQLLGILLLAFGVGCLLRQTGILPMSWKALTAGMLIVLGFGLVLTARRGRRRWPILLGVVLIMGLASSSASLRSPFPGTAVGDLDVRPTTMAELQPDYRHGLGDLTINLTQLALPNGTTSLRVQQGVGNLHVLVPEGVAVEVSANIGTGHLKVLGKVLADGVGLRQHYRTPEPADRTLSLQVHLGAGDVEVTH
jgi:hypothetical protein